MNLQEIKSLVKSGKIVHWMNDSYIVVVDEYDQYMIMHTQNASCCGLTWLDGKTLNGLPEEFYLGDA